MPSFDNSPSVDIRDLGNLSTATDSALRSAATAFLQEITHYYRDLSEILYEIHRRESFFGWGFNSFGDYARVELGLKPRAAWYFVQVAKSIHDNGLDWDFLAGLPWTKIKLLARVINADNCWSWTEFAQANSIEALNKAVRDEVRRRDLEGEEGSLSRPPAAVALLRVPLTDDELTIVNEAIELAKMYGEDIDSLVSAIVFIAYDFSMRYSERGPSCTVEQAIEFFRRVYGWEVVPVNSSGETGEVHVGQADQT